MIIDKIKPHCYATKHFLISLSTIKYIHTFLLLKIMNFTLCVYTEKLINIYKSNALYHLSEQTLMFIRNMVELVAYLHNHVSHHLINV